MKFIIICATGRSGSTTLQRIINTIGSSNIYGENDGAINNLLKCYQNIKEKEHAIESATHDTSVVRNPMMHDIFIFSI